MHINIYQIYYRNQHISKLDPGFIPYDNRPYPDSKWCEYGVFVREYSKLNKDAITGFVSWKFRNKTNLSSEQVLRFCSLNPDLDMYSLYPLNFGTLTNVWMQGENYHPKITLVTQQILDALSYDVDLRSLVHDQSEIVFCHYFAGSYRFWQAYMEFSLPIYHYINNHLDKRQTQIINSAQIRKTSPGMHPYIMERLLPTFLTLNRETWKHVAFPKSRVSLEQRTPSLLHSETG